MTKIAVALLLLLLAASPVLAFDANQTFRQGSTILSVEGGGGTQSNLERHRIQSDLDLWYVGVRYALLPFKPAGPSILHGSLEVGLEPIYQHYTGGREGFWAGLSAQGKWHFLSPSLGRFVPYIEVGAGAGGTDLRAIEIDSTFAFLLSAGVGVSFFVTDQAALYAGYRMVHISNGHTSRLNRGFEADTGLVGFSYFFK
jgi:opacity protein-like surface antigen